MANVHDIVRTHAILTFLNGQVEATATLAEIAAHFGTSWRNALNLLWDANLIEIPGMVAPFDLVLPDRPEQWDGTGEPPGPDSLVQLGDSGSGDVPQLSLTLDEVMVLVALLDNVLEVTPAGDSRKALRELRGSLIQAASDAGFGQALWREPEAAIGMRSLETIIRCINEGRVLSFSYHRAGTDLHETVQQVSAVAISISTGTAPVLHAVRGTDVRSYRLDRIGDVSAGERLAKQEIVAARRAVEAQERESRAAVRGGGAAWHPQGESVTLHLTRAGKWAGETLPGALTREEGDTLVVTLNVTSEEWLFSLLLQLGDAVLAVEPQRVAEDLAERFTRLLEETL